MCSNAHTPVLKKMVEQEQKEIHQFCLSLNLWISWFCVWELWQAYLKFPLLSHDLKFRYGLTLVTTSNSSTASWIWKTKSSLIGVGHLSAKTLGICSSNIISQSKGRDLNKAINICLLISSNTRCPKLQKTWCTLSIKFFLVLDTLWHWLLEFSDKIWSPLHICMSCWSPWNNSFLSLQSVLKPRIFSIYSSAWIEQWNVIFWEGNCLVLKSITSCFSKLK